MRKRLSQDTRLDLRSEIRNPLKPCFDEQRSGLLVPNRERPDDGPSPLQNRKHTAQCAVSLRCYGSLRPSTLGLPRRRTEWPFSTDGRARYNFTVKNPDNVRFLSRAYRRIIVP
jgi:hypothetical protein